LRQGDDEDYHCDKDLYNGVDVYAFVGFDSSGKGRELGDWGKEVEEAVEDWAIVRVLSAGLMINRWEGE